MKNAFITTTHEPLKSSMFINVHSNEYYDLSTGGLNTLRSTTASPTSDPYEECDAPSTRKVTVSFSLTEIADRFFRKNPDALHKFRLLLGTRIFIVDESEIVKIACDRFPFKEQNLSWIKDTFSECLKESFVNIIEAFLLLFNLECSFL